MDDLTLKTKRRIIDYLHKYASEEQINLIAQVLKIAEASGDPCHHERVICLTCGREGTPAQLMASRPRTRSPEAQQQSRDAVRVGRERKAKEVKASPLREALDILLLKEVENGKS